MPNNNETTTQFKVDISELKKSMQEARRAVAVANSEFKAVSSSMDDWTKSSDGLSAKLKQLDSNLNSQKSILKSLEAQYELTVKEMGEGSKAADDLKIKINNQKAVINNTEREISKYSDALEEVSSAEKVAAKSGKTIAEVLDDTNKKAEAAEEGFTILKSAVANFAGNALTSLVGGLRNAASNLLGLADSTREYRTELAKMNTAATESGASTDYIKEKWQDLGAVLGDEGAVAEGLNNLLAAGFTTEKEMDAITKSLEGAAIKWKDTLKFEGLADGLQETLATGSAVGSFGEMLERSGVNLDTFNEGLAGCTTEADKQNYVLKQLSKLGLSEVSDSFRSQNKELIKANKANSKYTDNMATMGAKIEPVTTKLKEGVNSLLEKFIELIDDVDMESFATKMEEAFKVLIDDVLPAMQGGLGWIIDNKDIIIAGLSGIAAGFVAFKVASIIQGLVSAFQAWRLATEGMTIAQAALNVVMNANPIGIIVTVIGALVAAFIYLWNTSEEFRNFWIGLWEGIKSACGAAIEGIGKFFTETIPNFFSGVINFIRENWDTLLTFLINPFAGLFKYFYENNSKFKEFVDNAIKFIKELPVKVWTWLLNTINKVIQWRRDMINKAKDAALGFINKVVEFVKQLPAKVWTWLTDVVSKVVSWGSDLAAKGKEAATKLFNAVVDKIKGIPDKLKSIGSDVVKGLWNGINDMTGWIKSKIQGFGDSVVQGLKDFFKIKSPSRLMRDEVGKWIPEGIAVGIDKNAKSVLNSMRELTANTVGAAREGVGNAATATGVSTTGSGVVNNFTQVVNSPKSLNRLELYRQTKNLFGLATGGA